MKVQSVISLVGKMDFYSLYEINEMLSPYKKEPRCKRVAEGLNIDEHRWYSIATDVYECEDGYVGITGPYQSFSEMQSWKDINRPCTAEEYEAIPSITYKPKKGGER